MGTTGDGNHFNMDLPDISPINLGGDPIQFSLGVTGSCRSENEEKSTEEFEAQFGKVETPKTTLLFEQLNNEEFWTVGSQVFGLSGDAKGKTGTSTVDDEDGESLELDPEITPEFLPLPAATSWVDGKLGESVIINFFEKCSKRFREREWRPYRFNYVPKRASYQKMAHGTCGWGYVVRLKDPWDFHMIFEGPSVTDFTVNNQEWKRSFRMTKKPQPFFENALQLFHGISILMGEYRNFLTRCPEQVPSDPSLSEFEYDVGDLVIVKLSRDSDAESSGTTHVERGYRGAIKEIIQRREQRSSKMEEFFLVYFLDTGEEHVVAQECLTPLPRSFAGFPPMAVKCSLHGISPIGPEWSSSATERMKQLVKPEIGKTLFAEFFLNKPKEQDEMMEGQMPSPSSGKLLSNLLSCPPFSVELRTISESEPSLTTRAPGKLLPTSNNISAILIGERFGMEWSLIPSRSHLRQPKFDLVSEEAEAQRKMDGLSLNISAPVVPLPSASRDEVLFFCEGASFPVAVLSDEQLDHEGRRLFADEPYLEAHIVAEEENEITMKIPNDGDMTLTKESILSFFSS